MDREFSNSEYDKLKKVYSIFICMNAPMHIGNAMAEYRITKEDIIGNIPEPRKSYDKLSVIIICLNEKLKKGTEGTLHGFLNTLLSPEMDRKEKEESLERDYGMKMEYELGEELSEMCNLSEAIEEKAMKRGKIQGLNEGIQQGIQQGIQILIEDNLEEKIPEDRIIEKLQKKFKLNKEEAVKYLEKFRGDK